MTTPIFGQLVIGPPGSGKTTYCHGMAQFLRALGRKAIVINLDPANDVLPYDCAINVDELVALAAVMEEFQLGPNGGMMYCMEYIEKNVDWLRDALAKYPGHYLLFDCPGQAELYTHDNSMKSIVTQLGRFGVKLTVVHMIDSHHIVDPGKYVAALLLSLQTMLKLELPHVNVLSKIDLVEQYGDLSFDIEYYAEVMDLKYLLHQLDNERTSKKYHGLNQALCELVEDFNLVAFLTLNVEDREAMADLLKVIDKANGFMYGHLDELKEAYMLPPNAGNETVPIGDDSIQIHERAPQLQP